MNLIILKALNFVLIVLVWGFIISIGLWLGNKFTGFLDRKLGVIPVGSGGVSVIAVLDGDEGTPRVAMQHMPKTMSSNMPAQVQT